MRGELTVSEWFDAIHDGLEYRFTYGQEKMWSRVEAIFNNGHRSSGSSGPNIIYSTGDAFLSSMEVNPQLLVDPRRVEQVDWAPCVESLDNNLIDDISVKPEFDTANFYAFLWGVSFIKIGYDSEWGFDPALDVRGTKAPVGATLTQFGKDMRRLEYSDLRPGMPWIGAVPPHDIVVPWGTRTLDNCPWIAHRVVRHIDDVKADMKYKSRGLQPVMSMRDFVESYQTVNKPYRIGPDLLTTQSEGTGEAEFVEMWEIHDRKTGKIFVIATGYDKFLRNDHDALQLRGLPFVEVSYVPKGRTLWRTGDGIYLLNHQAELTDITIQARKQRRLNVLKFIAKKNAFTLAEKNKLLSRDIGAVAEADTMGSSIADCFFQVPQNNANMALYQEKEDVSGAARETVGFDRNSYGEYRGARTTAREVQAVQGGVEKRMNRRLGKLASAYVSTFEKINQILFKYWTTPRVAQAIGPDGAAQWMQFTPAELAGDYNLSVSFDDSPVETAQSRQGLAMQAVQMSMTDPTIDPIAARKFLARSFKNANIAGIFKPGVIQNAQGGLQGLLSQMGQAGAKPGASGVQQNPGTQGSRLAQGQGQS